MALIGCSSIRSVFRRRETLHRPILCGRGLLRGYRIEPALLGRHWVERGGGLFTWANSTATDESIDCWEINQRPRYGVTAHAGSALPTYPDSPLIPNHN